jgi:HAD superfamily hydrolase (TIGR01509 family)
MNLIDTILFDWDGTLIDTAQTSFAAFRKAQADLGIPVTRDYYEQIYSPNWYTMYETLRLPREKWQAADCLWLQHYGDEIPDLVEGAKHVLDKLGRNGYCLGIVTSGSRLRVLREIKMLGLTESFGAVVCNEDVANKKPHPEGLEMAMSRMGKMREVCCYVGDSPDDVEMGKRANIHTVAVMSRYPGGPKLQNANPDFCFPSIIHLLELFDKDGAAPSSSVSAF